MRVFSLAKPRIGDVNSLCSYIPATANLFNLFSQEWPQLGRFLQNTLNKTTGLGIPIYALLCDALEARGPPDVVYLAALMAPSFSMDKLPTGQINLEVKDPSGAPMAASGKLESVAPGVQRTFQTDAQGT